jgi:hypothetical protein
MSMQPFPQLRTNVRVVQSRAAFAWVSARGSIVVAGALALQVVTGSACAMKQPNSQAALPTGVLLDFRQRVSHYVTLQRQLQTGDAALRPSDAAAAYVARRALAARLRTARASARQGDIFTPAAASTLRLAMNKEIRGLGGAAHTRASIRDDAPAAFRLEVNADYPEGASLPTMPPNVLAILPPLPEALEYRIVDDHLILRDRDANIVVDYIFNVMCAKC